VLSVTAAFTLLMAIVFGWYATRSITGPLATLDKGAKALGSVTFSTRSKSKVKTSWPDWERRSTMPRGRFVNYTTN